MRSRLVFVLGCEAALLACGETYKGVDEVSPDASTAVDAAPEAAPGADAAVGCTEASLCTPDKPRLLAPHSTGTVTSRQPTFRFTAAAKATRYEVQLCADPACAKVLETVRTTGTSVAPTMPLPASAAVFWRVVAVHDAFSTTSVTWELFVGHGNAAHATSWLGPPDFDRDGHADVALGSGANAAYVMASQPGAALPAAVPSQTLTGKAGFGDATANAGDVNGDGYGDLVVGGSDPMAPSATVFFGGPSKLAPTQALLVDVAPGADGRVVVGGAGDVDGDGYADVLVSVESSTSLFLGGPTGPAKPSGVALDRGSASGAGDVNADGFADVVVCDRSAETMTVYLGSPAGLGAPLRIAAPTGATTGFGEACITAGDVNGDGYADILVATGGTASAYVFYGSANGILPTGSTLLAGGAGSGGGVTTSIASAGDVNGDGFADVVVGAYNTNQVLVYHGAAGGVSTKAATTFVGLPAGGYANSVATVGDVNGDGYADIAFAPSQCANFSVFVYPGSATGVTTVSPLRTWATPVGSQCFGILAR